MSSSPIAVRPLHTGPKLTDQQLQLLKQQLIGLRRLTDNTGYSTNKQVIDMLNRVSPADLILLGLMFDEKDGPR
jgi:hypothetical protein